MMMMKNSKLCLLTVVLSVGLECVVSVSCNFAGFLGPVREGVCDEFISSGVSGSTKFECDSDGNSGTIYFYVGNSCSNSPYYTLSYDFDTTPIGTCVSSSTDCDTSGAYRADYDDPDCDGARNYYGTWSILESTECVAFDYLFSTYGYIYKVNDDDDLELITYAYENCTGESSAQIVYEYGCDNNGSYFEFGDDVTQVSIGSYSLSKNTKHLIVLSLFALLFLFAQ